MSDTRKLTICEMCIFLSSNRSSVFTLVLFSYRQLPVYNGDLRWHTAAPTPNGPYLAYPILSSPQPPVSNDYAYYQIVPAPCPPVMGFYQQFAGPYGGPVQPGMVATLSADLGERSPGPGQAFGTLAHRGRGVVRSPAPLKVREAPCPGGGGAPAGRFGCLTVSVP